MVKIVLVFSPWIRAEGRAASTAPVRGSWDRRVRRWRPASERSLSSETITLADRFRIHRLGKHLDGKQIVVTVHDQAGQKVAFAEDHAIGVAVVDHAFAIADGFLNTFPQQAGRSFTGVGRNHADGDLRGAAVERGAQKFAAIIGDAHAVPGRNSVCGDDVGAIDPDVAVLQALGAAARDFHDGKRRSA